MYWYTEWKYPLLLDDSGRVIAKDNFPCKSGVVIISGRPTFEEFIRKAEEWWGALKADMTMREE